MGTYLDSQPDQAKAKEDLITEVQMADTDSKLEALREKWTEKLQAFCKPTETESGSSTKAVPQAEVLRDRLTAQALTLEMAKDRA